MGTRPPQLRRHRTAVIPLVHGWMPAVLWACCLTSACGDDASKPRDEPPDAGPASVDVGVTGGPDGLDFVALQSGGEIPLHTFGQGGTHALLAVRCVGLGNRAFVTVSITNLETGRESSVPAGTSPRLLLCEDERTCDLLPLLIMTGGLVAGSSSTTIPVRVSAEAHNADGIGASVEREAVLSTIAL